MLIFLDIRLKLHPLDALKSIGVSSEMLFFVYVGNIQ